jgi:hypothetical protein
MALRKPYDISIRGKVVDGNEVNKVSWKTSGDYSTSFAITVLKNIDNSVAWSLPKTSSYALSYDIPANSLANGVEYKIQIQIWDDANSTVTSDYEIFETSSRPTVSSTIGGTTIANQEYTFSATYTQAESVLLQSYIVFLYNDNKNLLAQSSVLTTEPIEYIFSGLESEKSYHIEFQVTSQKGLVGTTGLLSFYVLYTAPQINSDLTAENVENAGIKLSWSVVQVLGTSDTAVTYLNSEKADLTNGNAIQFQDGFSVSSDFTLKLWIENPLSKKDLLIINGINGELKLQYDAVHKLFILTKTVGTVKSTWTSQELSNLKYFVCIQQIGNGINLFAETIS